MKRATHRRLLLSAQLMIVAGLALASGWNVAAGLGLLAGPGWGAILLPGAGAIVWLVVLALPRLLAAARTGADSTGYRLTYDAPAGWSDAQARQALSTLARRVPLGIIWAREQEGSGCWLTVPETHQTVLRRLVADLFPAGQLEAEPLPPVGAGVVILGWQSDPPPPDQLCRQAGIEGVSHLRLRAGSARVVLWGPGAIEVAEQFAPKRDILAGGPAVLARPPYLGEDPWPTLPPFPSSQINPGLTSVSRLERTAPGLRVSGRRALVVGHDAEGQPVGFDLPGLAGLKAASIWGQAAERVVLNLAEQAVRAKVPLLFLDGRGAAAAQLGRRLFREVATGRLLVCDTERPARSQFRLNPLWLPAQAETWPAILSGSWLLWLKELGVTPAGLGREAFRHSRVAVVLTALAAAGQALALDVAGLRDALAAPDFLALVERETLPHAEALEEELWSWWLTEGRQTPNFDLRLRLGHLRDRLDMLLTLPEYELLWQPPYVDPLAVVGGETALIWRFSARPRLQAYISSQLTAIATLVAVWPNRQPLLVIAHELPLGQWTGLLRASTAVRLVVSAGRMECVPAPSETLLLSRLHREDAGHLAEQVEGIRAADLRRLPDRRLLLRRGSDLGTIDID